MHKTLDGLAALGVKRVPNLPLCHKAPVQWIPKAQFDWQEFEALLAAYIIPEIFCVFGFAWDYLEKVDLDGHNLGTVDFAACY